MINHEHFSELSARSWDFPLFHAFGRCDFFDEFRICQKCICVCRWKNFEVWKKKWKKFETSVGYQNFFIKRLLEITFFRNYPPSWFFLARSPRREKTSIWVYTKSMPDGTTNMPWLSSVVVGILFPKKMCVAENILESDRRKKKSLGLPFPFQNFLYKSVLKL